MVENQKNYKLLFVILKIYFKYLWQRLWKNKRTEMKLVFKNNGWWHHTYLLAES